MYSQYTAKISKAHLGYTVVVATIRKENGLPLLNEVARKTFTTLPQAKAFARRAELGKGVA